MKTCKFCGRELVGSRADAKHCPVCGQYCLRKCEKAAHVQGWHFEPCVSCEMNPYRQNHVWTGEKWIKDGDCDALD